MSKNTQYFLLFLLTVSTILPKWILSLTYFDNSTIVNTIFNVKDIQYFPIIISISDFIFNPSYLENYNENKLLPFPIYGIILHSLFFKIFGIFSIISLEFILQLIFLIVFFKTVDRIFNNLNFTLIFCFLIYLFISFLNIILIFENSNYLKLLFDTLDQNLGSRFPRPLFTGIIYFYFFLILYEFKEKLERIDLKYFIILFLLLSVFLNSFFYYFFNFSLFILLLSIRYLGKSFFKFLFENKAKIFIVISVFTLFSLPFFMQAYFGESDYSKRIGVIQIDLEKKLYLLRYYFLNLLRIEFLILLIPSLMIHLYLNKSFLNLKDQIDKINLYFYFIITSIIAPPIFFIVSIKLISIYHFLGILIFGLIFYLILSIYFIVFQKFIIGKKIKNNNILSLFLILIIFFANIYFADFFLKKNKDQINEAQSVQEFIINNDLINSNKKLFTNDLRIMNLWLLNKNKQLVISDGFTNSLKNDQIEFNLINSLKDFDISETEFKKLISFEKSKMRDGFNLLVFNYRYQANSLYTFSNIEEYTEDIRKNIAQTSPFRAQSQVTPEDEKIRLIELFREINLDNKLFPEVIILNKFNSFKNFKIKNKKYKLFYSSNLYEIYLAI